MNILATVGCFRAFVYDPGQQCHCSPSRNAEWQRWLGKHQRFSSSARPAGSEPFAGCKTAPVPAASRGWYPPPLLPPLELSVPSLAGSCGGSSSSGANGWCPALCSPHTLRWLLPASSIWSLRAGKAKLHFRGRDGCSCQAALIKALV